MGTTAQDFITQLHDLPGETAKNKQQNLFQLLNKCRSLKPEEVDFIAKNLQPTNHLEKILCTDILIYFRRFDELYENYKTGDEITVKKLSKEDWFFQKAFKEISPEKFTNTILPSVSYCLKLKILKKLPVDEERANEMFEAVSKRYGIFISTVLIPKCTVEKIHKILTTHSIHLTVAQLKVLFHKDSNLIFVYLDERKKFDEKQKFKSLDSLFKYIAQKNPKVFSLLFEKYEFDIQLGRRTTKRFIKCQAGSVAENTEDYLKVLNKSVAVRKMGSEIKSVLFKKHPGESENYWTSIIKYYPKNQQFAIFESAYNSVYYHKFGEDLDVITESMLHLIPDKDKRDILAQQKIKNEGISYLKYVTPENCLKQVMQNLNCSKGRERAHYVAFLTDCCFLNKDLASLLKTCELVSVRLKNDEHIIRSEFSMRLLEHDLDILEENHWKFILDILANVHARIEWFYGESRLLLCYLKYLVKNKKCIKEAVRKFDTWADVIRQSDLNKDTKLHRMLLIELLEIGSTKKYQKEIDAANYDCQLVGFCKKFNDKNPSDVIDVFNNPRLLKSVRRLLEEISDLYYFDSDSINGIKYIICQPRDDLQELKKLYFKNLKRLGRTSILLWFIQHEPKVLQDNFDDFLTTFAEVRGLNTNRLWKCIKKCTHLGLDKRTVQFCKQKLGEEGYKHKEGLVKALTILAPPPSHIEFIKAYVPVSAKVDLTDEEVKDLYNLQGKIVRFLHYLKSPVEVLNATFDFCKGDYLSFALAPLYSCIYHLPESETKYFIKRLDEIKAVSPKKHGMHLSCVIYDVQTVYYCLKTTTVPSLMATLKYFVKNPSEDLWKILETKINTIKEEESNQLKWALDIKVPLKYRAKYLETVWNVTEKCENEDVKKILFTKIDKQTIENLDTDFAFELIRRCIFKSDAANTLTANLLVYLKTDKKFVLLSEILSKLKKNCCDRRETQRIAHQKLNSFILDVFKVYMEAEDINQEFVSRLSALFDSTFTLSEAFKESITIKSMELKSVSHRKKKFVMDDETVNRCSKVLIKLNNDVCKEYGAFAVPFLTGTLSVTMFVYMFTLRWERVRLCHSMLKCKESVNDYLLILRLLPNDTPRGEDFVPYQEICTELSQVSDNVVQLEFNSFMKSKTVSQIMGLGKSGTLNWDQP